MRVSADQRSGLLRILQEYPMSQGKYLNVILTVNAALLGAIVWMQVTGAAATTNVVHAQTPPGGIPNAGGQRERMITELQQIKSSVDALRKTVEGGKMKVTLANIEELKSAVAKASEDRSK